MFFFSFQKHYKQSIEKERVEFMAFLQEYFKNASEDYQFMNTGIVRYVNVCLACIISSQLCKDFYVL